MRKIILWISVGALCLTLVNAGAWAQDDSMPGPPKVAQIIREEIKPGRDQAHVMNETAWTEAFRKAHFSPGLGIVSVTGPSEVWFLNGYASFADMEKDSQRMQTDPMLRRALETYGPKEADLVNESRTMTVRYRRDLSYGDNVNIGEYKYFQVTQVRFRLGESVEDYYKALNDARTKANVATHTAVYQVTSGAPVGSYITFIPMKSMAEWDAPPNTALQAAQKETGWTDMVPKAVLNAESRLFAFSPQMSIPTKEMIAADPGFWNPKPLMAKKAAPAKEGDKPVAAAKKEMKK